jgi:hypothetical protein
LEKEGGKIEKVLFALEKNRFGEGKLMKTRIKGSRKQQS